MCVCDTYSLMFMVICLLSHQWLFFAADATFTFNEKPSNPTVVVVGHNSSRVPLAWNYTATGSEHILLMKIQRLNNSNSIGVTLASRFNPTSQGKVADDFNKDGKFGFEDPTTLVINDVSTEDEYVYRCEVVTNSNHDGYKSDIKLEVYSKFYDLISSLLNQDRMYCFLFVCFFI